ncbi:MAG: RagB/SusD family nutrient uptake outer membrane protein [Prolixibacteraceae bacterium]|nr:RagB/SusD family nutrient uptake outer membrane protein [Prolixibacteraceae bacterium]
MTKLKNKIRFILGLTFIIYFTSCNLLFEPEETDISQIETYEQLINATNGVYGQFSFAINTDDYLFLNFNCDDLFTVRGSSSINGCIYSGNPKLDENYVYAALFKVVASINNIFEQFDIYGEKDNRKREIFGELLFLRAYCYFRLVRSYGQIPIIDDPYINYTVSKSSFTEIYEFIEYDLFQTIQFLPDNNKHCRFPFETPHRGVAKAMLAEVYLSWAGFPAKDRSKYELAAEMAREVIDSSSFFGFNLLPDFADLWKESGRYNQETVFSIYAENSSFYTGSCSSKPTRENIYVEYNFTTDNEILINGLNMRTEVNFYNSYPRSYRKDITFFNFIFEPKSFSKEYPATDSDYVYFDKVDLCSRIHYKKFYLDTTLILYDRETSDPYFGRYFNTYNIQGCQWVYLFRYAHTLLTYAEAAARLGNLDDKAYECINKIRRRAIHVDIDSPSAFDLQPGLSAEAFADSVVAERGWELAGEHEGRWFDLLRLERSTQIKNGTGKYTEDNFYFRKCENIEDFLIPIPERDIDLSPNLGDEE